jgi:hypothetical protein
MLRAPSRAPLTLPSPPPLEAPADFRARVEALGVALDDAQLHALGDHLARLLAMNEQLNLTAIREPGEARLSVRSARTAARMRRKFRTSDKDRRRTLLARTCRARCVDARST